MEKYVAVIGAANIDIGGTPFKPLIPADSNPGTIQITYGGVARNIAHNLAKLGVPVKLMTAVGGDPLGQALLLHCREVGMDTEHVLVDYNDTSSMYLYVNDHSGEMIDAIDQIKVSDKLTPEYIDSVADILNGAALVVADGNLSKEAYLHLKEVCTVPIYEDPVSTILSLRIKDSLDGIDTIKPNRLEAEYLTDMTIQTEADYRAAAEAILDMGVKRVFISMGADGILAADKDGIYVVGSCKSEIVCTTGAGDSAMAAIAWTAFNSDNQTGDGNPGESETCDESSGESEPQDGFSNGSEAWDDHTGEPEIVRAAKAANAVASMTVGAEETIAPWLSAEATFEKIAQNNMQVKQIAKID